MLKKSIIGYKQRKLEISKNFEVVGGFTSQARVTVDDRFINDPRATEQIKRSIEKTLASLFYSQKFKNYIYELVNISLMSESANYLRILELKDLIEKEMKFND